MMPPWEVTSAATSTAGPKLISGRHALSGGPRGIAMAGPVGAEQSPRPAQHIQLSLLYSKEVDAIQNKTRSLDC